jgi:peptide/nickel transport system substrate-binding protein
MIGRTVSRRVFLAASCATLGAAALGRTPSGGTLRLRIPWPVDHLDPHALGELAAALFAPAIADSLFALDSRGTVYPTLATSLPQPTPAGTRLSLRPGLVSARGKPLDARDVVFSFVRAKQAGARALLAPLGKPKVDANDGLSVLFGDTSPAVLASALASPLTALVPRGFSPTYPDGTGAFVAQVSPTGIVLRRNPRAARGAAFLTSVEVSHAGNLADALRAFEAGEVDVGWLGSGLHRPRPDATALEGPLLGWVVLRTGPEAKAWGAPGVAQRLLDAVDPARLAHLGLDLDARASGSPSWGGDPAELLVDEGAPHLVEIARTLAAILSLPSHEVRAAPKPAAELGPRRPAGRYALLLDFVRTLGPRAEDVPAALITASDPELALRPPRLGAQSARVVARSLALGVVGELRLRGASVPAFRGLGTWDLGAVWQQPAG